MSSPVPGTWKHTVTKRELPQLTVIVTERQEELGENRLAGLEMAAFYVQAAEADSPRFSSKGWQPWSPWPALPLSQRPRACRDSPTFLSQNS